MNQKMLTLYRPSSLLWSALLATLMMLAFAASARADLQFDSVGFSLSDPDGEFVRQAGAHPDFALDVALPIDANKPYDGKSLPGPTEALRTVDVDLPVGMVGNPAAFATCAPAQLANNGNGVVDCPVESQVGYVRVTANSLQGSVTTFLVGLYNMSHGPDVAAKFGFKVVAATSTITARVRPGDYGISSASLSVSQALGIHAVHVELWGVPADPSHDPFRQMRGQATILYPWPVPSAASRVPFFTNPTSCTDAPVTFAVRGDSWENPGVLDSRTASADPDGTPFVFDGCHRLPFDPSIDVQPMSRVADSPSGLEVDLAVPQSEDPDGLGTAHVRRVVTTLPEGMSVSPSSAAGLGACALSEIKLGSHDVPTCPDSSKIGSVVVDTPLLEDPLEGDVILAAQDDNPFHSLLALYIAVKGPGFYLKLPGRVDPDPVTGQLTTTFDNTPQLPFSRMRLKFDGGPGAPLANPTACGTYETQTDITSWATDDVVSLSSPMVIDEGCGARLFSPSFSAGSTLPFAGESSPFMFALTRGDRSQFLSRVDSEMPEGLLARIKDATQCPEPAATDGTCALGTEIGSTSVLSGPGDAPLALKGRVYLTGPYKGAPFGLSIVVPTKGQAGPFDLGDVVVRAAIEVDPDDASVSVKSDPFPTIIEGFPLRLRQAVINIDRPGFMVNPTSCAQKQIKATIYSTEGATAERTSPFRVGDCAGLAFTPKLGLRLTGKRQMRSGGHPALRALLIQRTGQSNIAKARVTLPRNVVLDSKNAYDPKLVCDYDKSLKADCPASTIVGKASLKTPILDKPLAGAVHLVQGIRFGPSGNRIRTLPTLLVKLRGEVAINLRSKTSVDSKSRLVSTFPNVPDAPAKRFALQINGGRKGILTVTENRRGRINLCNSRQTALVKTDGQNGKNADYPTRVKTPCAKKRRR
jgi:hypothetical protein